MVFVVQEMMQVLEKEELMVRELFNKQRKYLDYFFDSLNMEQVCRVLDAMKNCRGTIFFSGVGKSGFVANKIAMTMISTGTKAYCLSATDALHGDVGIVDEKDLFFLFSKSGETEELLSLIPVIRNRGAKIISVVCQGESRLARAADLVIELPLEKELCPFNLAPTTSPTLQMIFGDVLAVALMQEREFSLEQYAKNHPAGQIGKRALLKVKDLMVSGERIPLCRRTDALGDCLQELSEKSCGCLLVVDEKRKLQGIFTDGDLRRALQEKGGEVLKCTMEELMTSSPKSIEPEAMAWEAMKMMEEDQKQPIMVLPVLKKGLVEGLMKMHDLVQSGI